MDHDVDCVPRTIDRTRRSEHTALLNPDGSGIRWTEMARLDVLAQPDQHPLALRSDRR